MVPLEDMGRVTPLIEFFTQMNAPKMKKTGAAGQKDSAGQSKQQFFDYKKKQREKEKMQPSPSKLFQDILDNPAGSNNKNNNKGGGIDERGSQAGSGGPKLDEKDPTENMMKNRFNLNILKMRKDYEKFIPKAEADTSKVSRGNKRSDNSRSNGKGGAEDEPPSSKRPLVYGSGQSKRRDGFDDEVDDPFGNNNNLGGGAFEMREIQLRTDNSERPLKMQQPAQLNRSRDEDLYGRGGGGGGRGGPSPVRD